MAVRPSSLRLPLFVCAFSTAPILSSSSSLSPSHHPHQLILRSTLRTSPPRSPAHSSPLPLHSLSPGRRPPPLSSSSSPRACFSMTGANADTTIDIALDDFARRQFSADYAGTRIPVSEAELMGHVTSYYLEQRQKTAGKQEDDVLVDGYAPFCKHVFMPNFSPAIMDPAVAITDANEHLLRTRYDARTDDELPVLIRYFPKDVVKPSQAKYLDLILYSHEQIVKECEAMGRGPPEHEAPWRLISVKAQSVPYEIPMNPITIMRNELISQGGSGVPINRDAYMKSVDYWSRHAIIL